MTGAPRFVTVTRSPDWTMRTYSLSPVPEGSNADRLHASECSPR